MSRWPKSEEEKRNEEEKKEKRRRCFRMLGSFLLFLGCILIGKTIGLLSGRILVGLLGGGGAGLLLVGRYILFISDENDY